MGQGSLWNTGFGAARKGTTRRYVRFRYRGQKGKWNRRYGSVFPIVGWRLCNFRAPSMFASGISVSASCGLRPQVAYPVGPLPMKSLPSGAVSYEETGNIWNSKTGTIRYAIGCRICRNAGGRRLRGCPSLRRMPRENRRRSGAGPTRSEESAFFRVGARRTYGFLRKKREPLRIGAAGQDGRIIPEYEKAGRSASRFFICRFAAGR